MALPLILAGPILRRVQQDSVSVWLALSERASLRLQLYRDAMDASDANLAGSIIAQSDFQSAIDVGAKLYIVVATLDLDDAVLLIPGRIFSYNLQINLDGGGATDLLAEGLLSSADRKGHPHLPLGYIDGGLPSFSLPPQDLQELRLLHASCRKTHGPGRDALSFADAMIKDNRLEANNRPHLLVLTGDQIYADDVAIPLLPRITELGDALMENTPESIQTNKAGSGDWLVVNQKRFPAGFRQTFVQKFAGFTSTDAHSHLLTFADYAALYLFAWNNEVWPTDLDSMALFSDQIDLIQPGSPEFAETFKLLFKDVGGELEDAVLESFVSHFFSLGASTDGTTRKLLRVFENIDASWLEPGNAAKKFASNTDPDLSSTLEFAKNLAGVPAKKICKFYADLCDHFGDLQKESKVQLTRLKESYRTLPEVRRALANVPTYMIWDDHDVTDDWNVTRHWITGVADSPCGDAIIRNAITAYALFQDWGNNPKSYAPGGDKFAMRAEISQLFGATANGRWPAESPADALQSFFAQSGDEAVLWHYAFEGTDFKGLVLNTRTQRSFDSEYAAPELIPAIGDGGPLGQQIPPTPLIHNEQVLFVVTPVPALGIPVIEQIGQTVAVRAMDIFWFAARKKARKGSTIVDAEAWSTHRAGFERFLLRLAPNNRIVFLSGDVHYGAAAEMSYWRKDVDDVVRFVQFTSSPSKNAWPDPIVSGVTSFAIAQRILRLQGSIERMGWLENDPPPIAFTEGSVSVQLVMLLDFEPVLIPVRSEWQNATSQRDADFRWRQHLLLDERPDAERPDTASPSPLPSGDLDIADPLTAYREVLQRHADFIDKRWFSRSTVWHNNLGVIRFEDSTGEFFAVQELHAAHPSQGALERAEVVSEFRAALAPSSPEEAPLLPGDAGG